MSEIPGDLIEAIRSGGCVAFVGAGFSAAGGMPQWKELLLEVARGHAQDREVIAYV